MHHLKTLWLQIKFKVSMDYMAGGGEVFYLNEMIRKGHQSCILTLL